MCKHIFRSLTLVCIPLHKLHRFLKLPCSDIIDPQCHNHQPLKLTRDGIHDAKRLFIQRNCLKIISLHGLRMCCLIQHIGIIRVCLQCLIEHRQIPLALFLHLLWCQVVAVMNHLHWKRNLLKGFPPLSLILRLNLLMDCTFKKIIISIIKSSDFIYCIRGDTPALHKAFHLNLTNRARILLHDPAQ